MLHLDSAAVGRSSTATLDAVTAHTRLEAEVGGYVAQELASTSLEAARRDTATLLGCDPEGVAFVESGTAALDALLRAWPLPPGARVGVAASEWGPNLELLAWHGLEVVPLPVDGRGVLDPEVLADRLADDPPDAVLVDAVAAHRGLVQPAEAVVALGREHGVPVWLDAAQALGQVAIPRDADVVIATSRKWLTGPRGVGMLAVAGRHREALRVRTRAKFPDASPMALLESEEAHVAGRLGLGVAAREHLDLGADQVQERLVEVGRAVRDLVGTLPSWAVVAPDAPAAAITSVRPLRGQDVAATVARLRDEEGIVTSVCQPWRAPREMSAPASSPTLPSDPEPFPRGPWLRLSPHVDLTGTDLERLARALSAG